MRVSRKYRFLAAAGCGALALTSGAALAQPLPTPPVSDPDPDDPIIIVTAQKRAEAVQDVPLPVTVVTGDDLAANFLTDTKDLQKVAPTVTFGDGASTGSSSILIRGIGTSVFAPQVEPTVSVVVDGVVLSRNSQGFVDLIDIERVEVLKGPQGTLFGKNASGGVLNITTKRPSDGFSAEADFLAAENDEYQARASVSGPLGDRLGARLTGFYKTIDGNIQNTFRNEVFNGSESWGLRGKLEFEVSSLVNLYLIADYRHTFANASEETLLFTAQDGIAAVFARNGIAIGPNNRRSNTFAPIFEEIDDYGISFQADIDTGGVTLTSQTAFRVFETLASDDVDALAQDPAAIGAGNVTNSFLIPFSGVFLAGPIDIVQTGDGKLEQFTQEFRVTSPANRKFEYVGGVFISLADQGDVFTRRSDACIAPAGITLRPLVAGAPCVPNGFIPGTFIPDIVPFSQLLTATGGPPQFASIPGNVKNNNFAAFGQGTFYLSDRFSFTGGLRVQHDDVRVASDQFNRTSALGINPLPFSLRGSTSNTALSGKASVQYDSGPVLVYASYSRGYKGPTLAFDPLGNQVSVDPERSNGYEMGLKSQLWNNRLILNLAGFWTDYTNFQQEAFNPTTGFFLLQNVGATRTRGVEAEFSARPFDGFTLQGGIAYVDAEIRRFPNGPCFIPATADPGCVLPARTKNLAGFSIPNTPDWKANATADYEFVFGSLKAGARATVSYQDDVNFSLAADPRTVQEAYTLVDASIRFGDADDRWIATAFVRNLFDKFYRSSLFQDFSSLTTAQTFQRIPINADRRFGVSLRFNY